MGFELPNGKTARNLQEQVKFLSEKLKDLYAAVNEIGIRVLVVAELPEEGEPLTIYFVPSEDASQENIYNEYMWVEDEWELIGSTEIDLSDYMTLSTNQTVSGEKTFTTDTYFTGKISFASDAYIDYSSSAIHIHNLYNTITVNEGGTVLGDTCQAKGIQPISNNSYDLGTSSFAWKDLYLSGTANIGGALKIESPSQYIAKFYLGTSDVMTLGSQIEVNRTFRGGTPNAYDLGSSTYNWKNLYISGKAIISAGTSTFSIGGNEYNGLDIAKSGIAVMSFGGSDFSTYTHQPISNNTYDLGSSSRAWKNLYLSGNLADGTNSVSVADLAALITYAKGQGWIS